jgi:hypothetical protein
MASKRVRGVLGEMPQRHLRVPCCDAAVAGTVTVVGHREGGPKRRPFSRDCACVGLGCPVHSGARQLRGGGATGTARRGNRHGGAVQLGSREGKSMAFSRRLGMSSRSRAPGGLRPQRDGVAARWWSIGRRGENKARPCGQWLGGHARAWVVVSQDRGVAVPCARHRCHGPTTWCSGERATAAAGNGAARRAPAEERG